jgi:hypothetical protein
MYTFAPTRFAKTNSLWQQYFHIVSEVFELGIALLKKDMPHVGRESMDVRCSTETFQRILADQENINIGKSLAEVRRGHNERGYYE